MPANKHSLLFVCTGNLCRSPMAEYLLRHYLNQNSGWEIMSAGLNAVDGLSASVETIEVMQEKGIDVSAHRSRKLTKLMIDSSDLIVVMTTFQSQQIKLLYSHSWEKVFLLKSFNACSQQEDIPDPIGMPVSIYRKTRDEIEKSLKNLLVYLKTRDKNNHHS